MLFFCLISLITQSGVVNDTFFQVRMILRNQCSFSQLVRYQEDDQSYETKSESEFIPREYQGFNGAWVNHLPEIQPVTEDDHDSDENNGSIVTFGVPFHQEQQRSNKVDQEVQEEDWSPLAPNTRLEVFSFFRHVGVPDQHVLAEPEVGPEDAEREHELAEVVQVFIVHHGKISFAFQVNNEQCNEAQA